MIITQTFNSNSKIDFQIHFNIFQVVENKGISLILSKINDPIKLNSIDDDQMTILFLILHSPQQSLSPLQSTHIIDRLVDLFHFLIRKYPHQDYPFLLLKFYQLIL